MNKRNTKSYEPEAETILWNIWVECADDLMAGEGEGDYSAADVRDMVADRAYDRTELKQFNALDRKDREKILRKVFPNGKRYGC